MGKGLGQLAKIRGIIYYRLSEFEQRPLVKMVPELIPNTIRRIRESTLPVGLPLLLAYLVYEGAEREHHRLTRKNPAEFENDV